MNSKGQQKQVKYFHSADHLGANWKTAWIQPDGRCIYSLFACSNTAKRVYVLLAVLPGGQGLYILVNGPATNRKLIWQELIDVVEIREAWSIFKVINPANREIKFQLFGVQEL